MVDVTRRFRGAGETVTALDAVDAEFPAGRLTVVAGPSGSGKSTLLALLACTQRPDEGDVLIGQTDVGGLGRRARRQLRRDRLGIVLPQPSENLLDGLDAEGNLRWSAARRHSRPSEKGHDELLGSVGLLQARHRAVRELSGGEQQRLAIACALVGAPDVVVLDEPTASLDRTNAATVVEVLAEVARHGTTLVAASHDAMLIEAAETIIHLEHGRRTR
jgi:ABC-type lipoprotein export system ATPase subunit